MLLLVLFVTVVVLANDNVAHDNMLDAFGDALPSQYSNLRTPCQEPLFVCENDRVVGVVMAGKMLLDTFPDISGFDKLRNLTFDKTFVFSQPATLNGISNLPLLETFFVNGIGASSGGSIDWRQSPLPTTIGTTWPVLRAFGAASVRNFPSLPASVTAWTKLQMFFVDNVNQATGSSNFAVPANLASWASLQTFTVTNTRFGAPPTLGTKSVLASVTYRNDFGALGTFNDPLLFESPLLANFAITNFNIAGTLPPNLGHASSLTNIEIATTSFSGTIPSSVGQLKALRRLSVLAPIGGSLPTEIVRATALTELFLGETKLTGTIPDDLGSLNLKALILENQATAGPKLTGTIPTSVVLRVNRGTQYLQISNSNISGRIPDLTLNSNPIPIISVLLDNNRLQCTLPEWLIILAQARFVNVSGNDFCLDPNPLTTAQKTNINFAIGHTPCHCRECAENTSLECPDCAGVLHGSARYDGCGVCNGDGTSCDDCNGVAGGSSRTDRCGTCDGDNFCVDCAGVPFGSAAYDVCDVCNGNGRSCRDCAGVVHGTRVYDSCDVCGGDGLTCHDCAGVVGGPHAYDLCGRCVDASDPSYKPHCFDCAGVPYGSAQRSLCGDCIGFAGDDPDNCNPSQIAAGVAGLQAIWPWIVLFLLLDLGLLLCFFLRKPAAVAAGAAATTPEPIKASVFGRGIPPRKMF